MAVELASAYVSIIPTTKGLQGNLEKELSPLTGVAAKAGDSSGKALGSSFTGASGGLKSSLGESVGHFDNFKTKATGALGSVGISTGMLKAAGGAALIGFAVSAVGAFTDTAKAAIDMNAATGLSIEDSSRWIAVGDDMGISAETLQGSIGKVAKTLDETKWADFGIATRDAGGQARSTNDILLDTFDKLGGITNETERARAGNELFGKGYSNLAPLIGKTRAEMEDYLGSVEKGQVITKDEAESAEKMRLAQDQLGDALKEVGLAFGGLLAKISPVIVKIAEAVGWAVKLVDAYNNVVFATKDTSEETDKFADSVDKQHIGVGNVIADFQQLVNENFNAQSGLDKTKGFFNELIGVTSETDNNLRVFTNSLIGLAETSPEAATEVVKGFTQLKIAADAGNQSAKDTLNTYGLTDQALVDLSQMIPKVATATDTQTAATDGLTIAQAAAKGATDALTTAAAEATRKSDAFAASLQTQLDKLGLLYPKEYDAVTAKYDYAKQTETTMIAVDNLNTTLGNHNAKQEEVKTATDSARDAIIDQSEKYATLDGAALGSQGAIQRQIASLEAQRDALSPTSPLRAFLDGYIADLAAIPSNVNTELKLNISMGQVTTAAGDLIGVRPGVGNGAFASGGWASGRILAGEDGPELIDLPAGRSYVHTAAATRGLMASSPSMMSNATSTPQIAPVQVIVYGAERQYVTELATKIDNLRREAR